MVILWLNINSSHSHGSVSMYAIEANRPHLKDEWLSVEGTLSTPVHELVSAATDARPDIIAATCRLFNHDAVTSALVRIKTLMPDVTTIVGGPEFLGDENDNKAYLSANRHIDYILRGEGDTAFHQWVEAVREGAITKELDGICFIDKDGVYHDGGYARAPFKEIKPSLESRLFDWSKPFVQLETTRGCFNSCRFCVSSDDKPVRSIDIHEIERLCDLIVSKGVGDIRLLDRTFNQRDSRAVAMLDIFERYAGRLHVHLEVHPALLGDTLLERLSTMPDGMLHLETGIQSLQDNVITLSGRHGDVTASLNGLRRLLELKNLETHADLIAGLPAYDLESLFEDAATLMKMGVDELQIESLKVLPGTYMRRNSHSLGLIYSPVPPYEVLATGEMSLADMERAMILSRVTDGYYNDRHLKGCFSRLLSEDSSFLTSFCDYVSRNGAMLQPLSLESRMRMLHRFLCDTMHENSYLISVAWISAGLSMHKDVARDVKAYKDTLPEEITALEGTPTSEMRFYTLPTPQKRYIFGFDRMNSHSRPLFIGILPHSADDTNKHRE